MKKSENMICKICQTPIHPDSSYIILQDFKEGELFMTGHYHNTCWHQKLRNAVAMNREQLLGKSNEVLDRLISRMS